MAARWLRGLWDLAVRGFAPSRVARTLDETIERAGFHLAPGGWSAVALGHIAALQLDAWLEGRAAPRDHRAVVALDDPLPARLKTIRGSPTGVLGPESLRAGRNLRTWLRRLAAGEPLITFVSGDGLLVAESPRPGVRGVDLARLAGEMATLTAVEQAAALARLSSLKGGGAMLMAGSRPLILVLQSDLPPGNEAWLAGGPFEPSAFPPAPGAEAFLAARLDRPPGEPPPATPEEAEARLGPRGWQGLRVFAGANASLLQLAAQLARRQGLTVEVAANALDGRPDDVGARLAALAATDGPELILAGGRLRGDDRAPLARMAIAWGRCWNRPSPPLFAASSNGRDGRGAGGGVWWLPGPWDPEAATSAVERGDASVFFRRQGWLLPRGETQAAVGDVVMILRRTDHLRERE